MSCRQLELLLPAAVDGRLDPEPLRQVDNHLAGCTACAAELDAMHQARHALAACGPAEPPADLADRISHSVRMAAAELSAGSSFWDRFIPVALPAAVAATIGAAILLVMTLRTPAAVEQAVKPETADPVEQVSSANPGADVQLATNVLGMELEP